MCPKSTVSSIHPTDPSLVLCLPIACCRQAPNNPLSAAYKKYLQPTFFSVAAAPSPTALLAPEEEDDSE